jgi:hypothetical protein
MISLPLLHLPATLRSIASPLKLKLKHWIRTSATDHPPCTTWLPPSTAIKRSPQPCPLSISLNRVSIFPPPKLEHHTIRAQPAVVVPFYLCPMPIVPLHNDTHGDKLADPLLLPEQLIDIWIHVKRYLKFRSIARDYQLINYIFIALSQFWPIAMLFFDT